MLFGIRAHLDSMFPVCYTTSSSPERTTVAAPNGKLPFRRLSLRRPLSPGFPKGPQPLGTLTLLARSSVLYLRARDRHTRPAAFRFFLLARREGMPCPTPIAATRVPPSGTPGFSSSYFHALYPTNSITLGIYSHFRMTANAFLCFYACKKRTGTPYAIRKFRKNRRKFENRIPKPLFPHMSIVEEEYGFGLMGASISPGFYMVILKGGCSFEYHSDH